MDRKRLGLNAPGIGLRAFCVQPRRLRRRAGAARRLRHGFANVGARLIPASIRYVDFPVVGKLKIIPQNPGIIAVKSRPAA